jgi:hypothetical protein
LLEKISQLEIEEMELKNEVASKTSKIAKMIKKIDILEMYNKQSEKLSQTQPPPKPIVETKNKGTQVEIERPKHKPIVPELPESPKEEEKRKPEPVKVKTPKSKKFSMDIPFTITENRLLLHIHELHVHNQNYPSDIQFPIFLSIEFFLHENVITQLVQNDNPESAITKKTMDYKCNFNVDMTRMLLTYLALESLPIHLCVAQGSSWNVIGKGSLPLYALFLSDQSSIVNEAVPLSLSNNDNIVIATAMVSVTMDVPFNLCGFDPLAFYNYTKEQVHAK